MRIGLFLVTNLAVMFVLSIVLSLFGLGGTGNHLGLIIFASIFGWLEGIHITNDVKIYGYKKCQCTNN